MALVSYEKLGLGNFMYRVSESKDRTSKLDKTTLSHSNKAVVL